MTALITRRGACPTLARPMRTGDGLLVRIDPIGHELTPHGLAGLADAARRHGNGLLELTARGSLQIRGLSESSVPALAAAIRARGIELAKGVVVRTGPLAGLDPAETADPRPLARCGHA
jgi:precorrin-3B synthase